MEIVFGDDDILVDNLNATEKPPTNTVWLRNNPAKKMNYEKKVEGLVSV